MKYIKEYLETVVKIKPLGELTTKEDELNGLSGEMAYIDGKCADIFISHADYANWIESKYEQKSNPVLDIEIPFGAKDSELQEVTYLIPEGFHAEIKDDEVLIKKGKQKPAELHKKDEQNLNACLGYIPDEFLRRWLKDIIIYDKPADKVIKPKFKVGDWIAHNRTRFMFKVVVATPMIMTVVNTLGYHHTITADAIEKNYHLWSIADAKDGDVLQLGEVTAIFKEFIGNGNCKCYCSVCDGEFEIPSQNGADNRYGCHNAIPATKEQRDMLFQKMHEAGYIFEFEKKELKKIEPLTDFEKAFQGMCCEKNKQFVKECCKTLIELARKQLQSERNELELDETSYKVGVSRVLENPESYGLTKNRLKPSSSDIEALEDIMNGNSNPTSYLVLQSIIEQLKNT